MKYNYRKKRSIIANFRGFQSLSIDEPLSWASTYQIKAVTFRTDSQQSRSQKIMLLYQKGSPLIKRAEELARNEQERIRRQFDHETARLAAFTKNERKEFRVHRVLPRAHSYAVYSIFQSEQYLVLSVINLRNRRIIRSTTLTTGEVLRQLWVDESLRTRFYKIENAFYSHCGRKLCLLIRFSFVQGRDVWFKTGLVEVKNLFDVGKRVIVWNNFDLDNVSSYIVDEEKCTIFSGREEKKRLIFV